MSSPCSWPRTPPFGLAKCHFYFDQQQDATCCHELRIRYDGCDLFSVALIARYRKAREFAHHAKNDRVSNRYQPFTGWPLAANNVAGSSLNISSSGLNNALP